MLERHEVTVGELAVILQLPQSTISRHLKLLGDDGWVSSRAEGTSRYYRKREVAGSLPSRIWEAVREDVARSSASLQDITRLEATIADRRRRSREYFSTVAGDWDAVRSELFGTQLDLQLALALVSPKSAIGDMGCGSGRIAEILSPFAARVVAVDASREMLDQARQRLGNLPNVELVHAEMESVPLAANTLDIALYTLALPYIQQPSAALAEGYRLLRKGGRIVVIDMMPHTHEELKTAMGQLWSGFSAQQVRAWLGESGFSQVAIRALPADRGAKGPSLFLGTATKD